MVLVGGATRTPLVHRLLQDRLGRPVHAEIEPDLAFALGAAVQGALIAGLDIGPVLVDITPHTLGIEALGDLHGFRSIHKFAPIIERNTPLPATRTEVFTTPSDSQKVAPIRVFQGEDEDSRHNNFVGQFQIEGLAAVHAGNQIVDRLDLDLSGIFKVRTTERMTVITRQVTIDNATERFRKTQRTNALDQIEAAFETSEMPPMFFPSIEREAPSSPDDRLPANLRLLCEFAESYDQAHRECLDQLVQGWTSEALASAWRCLELSPDTHSRRLLALAALQAGNWAAAAELGRSIC